MSRYVVVDQDSFEPGVGMALPTEDIVDREGYRDTEQIVRDFMMAGQRLDAFRRSEFDNEGDQVELELPVERSAGFDMASASQVFGGEPPEAKIARLRRELDAELAKKPVVEPAADEAKKDGSV